MNGPQTDAAMYWKAGRGTPNRKKKDSAMATIADLEKTYVQSRWIKKMRRHWRLRFGNTQDLTPIPDSQSDDDLKLWRFEES